LQIILDIPESPHAFGGDQSGIFLPRSQAPPKTPHTTRVAKNAKGEQASLGAKIKCFSISV